MAMTSAPSITRHIVGVVHLVSAVGGLLGVYLTLAAAVQWWPFEGLPEIRIDVTASRINAPGSDDPADEYVCLVNKGDQEASMLGWKLRDAEGEVNTLSDFTLEPDQRVRVHPGAGRDSLTDRYGQEERPVWNNTGDTVTLLDDQGTEIDSRTYPEVQERTESSCR